MQKPALVIMAKIPSSGGKSRLQELLTPRQREQLQWAFLLDILDKTQKIKEFSVFLALTPAHRVAEMVGRVGPGIKIMTQPEGDLGVRMFTVASRLFKQRYGPVLIIGTDIPTLQPYYLKQALEELQNHSVVLGPTLDGGYYLIGLSYPEQSLFEDISWSTGEVFRQTLDCCHRLKLPCGLLPPVRDIDWPADLLELAAALREENTAEDWFPHRTADFLAKLPIL